MNSNSHQVRLLSALLKPTHCIQVKTDEHI